MRNTPLSHYILSTLYDVVEDFVVDGKLYRYGYSERLAAKDHLNYLKSLNIRDKCLLIFDRGYFAAWLCDEIESQGCYYLFRCKIGCHAGRDKIRNMWLADGNPWKRIIAGFSAFPHSL